MSRVQVLPALFAFLAFVTSVLANVTRFVTRIGFILSDKLAEPIVLELSLDQPSITFESFAEVTSWLETELEFWSWLSQCQRGRSLYSAFYNVVTQTAAHIRKYDANPEANVRESVLGVLRRLSSAGPRLVSTDRRAQFCMSCLLYTSPSPRDLSTSRMPSSA